MTAEILLSLVLALVVSVATAGLYLAWPRRMTIEEWVMHRRAMAAGRSPVRRRGLARMFQRQIEAASRFQQFADLLRADLLLIQACGRGPVAGEERLVEALLRSTVVGFILGLAAGVALWILAGHTRPPGVVVLLSVGGGVLWPGLRWIRFRRAASRLRSSIGHRLPRLLTGACVLLESGATTPQQALLDAADLYGDPAADVLREVLLDQQVRRVEVHEALDRAGCTYGLVPLEHLADAYRMSSRQGTRVADLLSEFARRLRQDEHLSCRERMTRAPVLMTVPALIFFVLPILALVLLLVLAPLQGAFGQL